MVFLESYFHTGESHFYCLTCYSICAVFWLVRHRGWTIVVVKYLSRVSGSLRHSLVSLVWPTLPSTSCCFGLSSNDIASPSCSGVFHRRRTCTRDRQPYRRHLRASTVSQCALIASCRRAQPCCRCSQSLHHPSFCSWQSRVESTLA